MNVFSVTITETLKRVVKTLAESAADAELKVEEKWKQELYVLESSDFVDVEFNAAKATKEEK